MAPSGGILRFLTCGSVDDGKSTLIGHLVCLTGNVYDDQMQVLCDESARAGAVGGALDYSLLMDGLMAEREQGITIDVSYRYFETGRRKFIVADTPGHEQYTGNMATGASRCSAAIILVDACKGISPQTRRHALICNLMGIRHLLFVVNKMDLVHWQEQAFLAVEQQCADMAEGLRKFSFSLLDHSVVPVSAVCGDNLTEISKRMRWYQGSTMLDWLECLPVERDGALEPLRLVVQYVIKIACNGTAWQNSIPEGLKHNVSGTYRAYAGIIASGNLVCGDSIVVLPSGLTAKVREIRCGSRQLEQASAGMSVSIVLDSEHDVIRGDCIASAGDRPEVSNMFKVRLVWMDTSPLYAGRRYLFKGACGGATAEITRIRDRIDLVDFQLLAADRLAKNDIGEADLSISRPIPFDQYQKNRETGCFVLIDSLSNATVACGMILHSLRRSENIHWHTENIGQTERAAIKGQNPFVIWLTGLSGSGKSTLANAIECRLVKQGRHTMLLDGDNVRHGLNRDLGFTEADRVENIRRIGEVAKLMTEAGLIVITAFISPYRSERELVRNLIPEGRFMEVFLATPLEACEKRDPKGLYRKARSGQIPNFTGINAPYEEPEHPELRLDTSSASVDECVDVVIELLRKTGCLQKT